MSLIFLVVGAAGAIALLASVSQVHRREAKLGLVLAAMLVLLVGVIASSFRYVGEQQVGIVVKNALGPSLPPGKIIATAGEKGPQARVLPPGWHLWLWPVIYDVQVEPVTRIAEGEVGLLTASDGQPMPSGAVYAPEWPETDRKRMAEDAVHFLSEGKGYKGPQTTVLSPGTYRINTKLFTVVPQPVTNIEKATVGVVKSNVGDEAEDVLVPRGRRGIWNEPLMPGKYNINPKAYEVTAISTKEEIAEFTKNLVGRAEPSGMERAITVRTTDGFEFPVDVRVVYQITPENAPKLVARLRDDDEGMLGVLQGSVRSIFRNNAQSVKALDYVQQRVQQEQRSLDLLRKEMEAYGITVNAVRIADLGDTSERWQSLLKTQTDREIALQEQETFKEQQRAAEQKKELTRTEQETEEERRLATATYAVKIAEQTKQQQIIAAQAEAEAIEIRAEAQASAYQRIALQIGKSNAALIEVLKIVGERNIQITPRVMVTGGATGNNDAPADAQTAALIGTMLDTMVSRDEPATPSTTTPPNP